MADEWEFQGDVLKWMTGDLAARPGLKISDVGQEKQYANQKRSDLIIWTTRDVDALAAVERKTLSTPLSDKAFQDDVIKKARRVGAPYCVQWNQRDTAIYATSPAPGNAGAIIETVAVEPLSDFPELSSVATKDYVGKPALEAALSGRARARPPRQSGLDYVGASGVGSDLQDNR